MQHIMKCPQCNGRLKTIKVSVQGAKATVDSCQCPECNYFAFEPNSSRTVIKELRDTE